MSSTPRIDREKKTVRAMVRIYCQGRHATPGGLCAECEELLEYAFARLDRCPFGESKATCADCTTHCYRQEMKDRVKTVMRYAGPRMLFRHPLLALRHWLDGRRRDKPAGGN